MKKIIIAIAAVASIVLSNAALAAELGPSCTTYFEQMDTFVTSNPQGEAMKAQYDMAKKQMSSIPGEAQEAACKQASDLMSQAMKSVPAS